MAIYEAGYVNQFDTTYNPKEEPFFIYPDGSMEAIDDDKIFILSPDTYISGDFTGPCRILLCSLATELRDGTIIQKILYMHATPGSPDAEDPRNISGIRQKKKMLRQEAESWRNFGYEHTRVIEVTQAEGYLGQIFQKAFKATNLDETWSPELQFQN